MKNRILIYLITVIGLLSVLISGCDKRSIDVPSYEVTLILSSTSIVADNNDETYVVATAKVTDPKTGIDATDVPVKFSVVNGRASEVNPLTDQSGSARVNIYDIGSSEDIIVRVTAGSSKAEKVIKTMENTGYSIHKITASPEFIYSDNNVTFSTIKVIVRDSDNFPASGKKVKFQTTGGTIQVSALTDTTGVASALFWDSGDPAQNVLITAFVDDVIDTVGVEIRESPEIQDLNLNINSTNLNVTEMTEVSAVAIDDAGNYVPDGTDVIFTSDLGIFVDGEGNGLGQAVSSKTSNGIARVKFNSGNSAGTAHLQASVGGKITSGNIDIYPGMARFIYLVSDPAEVPVNTEGSIISASVEDLYHNKLRAGTSVNFETNIGSITPVATTDENGQCTAEFSPGTAAGFAEVSATVGDSAFASTVVNVTSDTPAYLVVKESENSVIYVEGSGQISSAALTVEIYDMMNNLVTVSQSLRFKLLNYPEGTSINNEGTEVIVSSANGQAQISVNAGTQIGPVTVEISLVENEDIKIVNSDIIIRSGKPDAVSCAIGGYNEGENIGGGLWLLELAATVTDQYSNPVPNGTDVAFEIVGNPDWASIYGSGFIGNVNADGDSTAGVAYTTITYDGIKSNEEISIKVIVGQGENNVEFILDDLVLPMNDVSLVVIPDPFHIDFNGATPTVPAVSLLNTTVMDGQANPMNDCICVGYGTLGDFIMPEPEFMVDPNIPSRVITNEDGITQLKVLFYEEECPPANPPPGSNQGALTVEIPFIGVSYQVNIQIWNYAGL
ncbi:MAG: hypothetical protein CSB55_03980 [Candidatus Cloacimonadota bacterium]|nr:MAG: hypothetical protein CSB55_03980 [Candidatus Cloacimonadota bacterium]